MVLPKDPIKREEALKNIKEAAIRRSQNPAWKENVKKSHKGIKPSEETKEKMRQSHIGKHSGEDNPMFGKIPWNKGLPMKEESRLKLSETKKNKHYHHSDEWKLEMSERNSGESNPFYGKHHEPGKFVGENNPMFGKMRSEESKLAQSISRKGQCRGEENSNWNGGITPLRKAIRESSEMYEWKKKVMERDGYKDIYTGEVGYLEVHHKTPFEELLRKYNIQTLEDARNCKELWDIDNGETMLKRNHRKYHGLVGEDDGE
jgi:hypothetical protein